MSLREITETLRARVREARGEVRARIAEARGMIVGGSSGGSNPGGILAERIRAFPRIREILMVPEGSSQSNPESSQRETLIERATEAFPRVRQILRPTEAGGAGGSSSPRERPEEKVETLIDRGKIPEEKIVAVDEKIWA